MKKILFILLIPFSLFSQVTDKIKLRNGTTFYEESIQNILSNSFEDGQGLEWEANPIGLSKYNLGFPILHSGDDILVDRYIRFAPNTSLKFYTTEPSPLVSQFSITNDLYDNGYATIHLKSRLAGQFVENRITAHGTLFDIVAGRDMQIEANNLVGSIYFDAYSVQSRPSTKIINWYGSQQATIGSGSKYFSIDPIATTLSGLAQDNTITEVIAIDPSDNKLYRKSISSILTSASGATTNTITPVGTNSFYTTVNGVNSNNYNVVQGLSLNYNGATTNNLAVTVNGNTSTTTIPTYTAGSGIGISGGVITNNSASKWTQSGSNIYNSNAGNVGIGTSTPSTSLEVNGQVKITGGSPGLNKVLTSDANGLAVWQDPNQSQYWALGMGATQVIYANPTNTKVGIGTNSPTEALDVVGKIKTTQFNIPTNAAANSILVGDANGDATWSSSFLKSGKINGALKPTIQVTYSGGSPNYTVGSATGSWTKIGDIVTVNITFSQSVASNLLSGTISITNLATANMPLTSSSSIAGGTVTVRSGSDVVTGSGTFSSSLGGLYGSFNHTVSGTGTSGDLVFGLSFSYSVN